MRELFLKKEKGILLEALLRQHGVEVKGAYSRKWGKARCIRKELHNRGDRNPSMSVSLVYGQVSCFACGLKGDVYELAKLLHGWDARQTNKLIGR